MLEPSVNTFTEPLLENLRKHPKRLVFTGGEDARIIRVASWLVQEMAAAPILLGRRDIIRRIAEQNGIPLDFVRIIEPAKSPDVPVFCERLTRIQKIIGNDEIDVCSLVVQHIHFAAMMTLYGQADSVIAGNSLGTAAIVRAAMRYRHDFQHPKLFGINILHIPEFAVRYGQGTYFTADSILTPVPTVEQLAHSAVETSKFARHLLGHTIQTSMLSASTLGSKPDLPANRVQAAVALAQAQIQQEGLTTEIAIEGEIQIDAAISHDAYSMRVKPSSIRRPSNVLIFPTLDAADITTRLLNLMGSVHSYGHILSGILFPLAMVTRLATEEQIYGTALIVGNEAIKYHHLYPEGTAPVY